MEIEVAEQVSEEVKERHPFVWRCHSIYATDERVHESKHLQLYLDRRKGLEHLCAHLLYYEATSEGD